MRKRKARIASNPPAIPTGKPLLVNNFNEQSLKTAPNSQLKESSEEAEKAPKKLKQLFLENFTDFNKENENEEFAVAEKKQLPLKNEKRILNKELGRNVEAMQPLMSMDKELFPMMSGEENEVADPEQPDKNELENNKAVIEFRKPLTPIRFRDNELQEDATVKIRSEPEDLSIANTRSRHIVRQTTYYDTWYVIRPKIWPTETRQQRHFLELPLVKLANAAKRMKLPSAKWSSKVTLYKVAPAVLERHTLTIFTGDLTVHKIPERERHKYQPSCVIFRRELPMQERHKCHVPYDRVIIFKHKHFTVNFDGKLVNLCGAPEAVTCLMDVQKLLDILESITLANSMIEIVTPK